MIKIMPSILSADFCRLGEEIKRVENAGALHFDVMDGHFVPNISFGFPVLKATRKATDAFLDVHLMISHPLDYAKRFVDAGADQITFHLESESNVGATVAQIKGMGCRAGIAIKPSTPAASVMPYVTDVDQILVMTVEPGFGGQTFMSSMMDKIRLLRSLADQINPNLDIQVDGGINYVTARVAIDAGANVLVAGSFIFDQDNPAEVIDRLLLLDQEYR